MSTDRLAVTARKLFTLFPLLLAACGAPASAPRSVVPATPGPTVWAAPAGFDKFSADIAYRRVEGVDCLFDKCYGIEVVTRDGCPTSLYAEIAILDASLAQIGYSNDTTSKLRAEEHAKLVFEITEDNAEKVRVTEITCR